MTSLGPPAKASVVASPPPPGLVAAVPRFWSTRSLFIALLVAVAMVPFLFSPRVPPGLEDANCVTVNDWGPIHLTKNCDSEEFQYLARDPSLMFFERTTRQNRPLYPALGWIIAAPIRASGLESIGARLLGRQASGRAGPAPGAYFPEYVAFVLINMMLLVASVIIMMKLLRVGRLTETVAVLPVAMLLVNEVTKAFFWTPHQQIFNVFVPVMSVWLYNWMQNRGQRLRVTEIAGVGMLLGVASLAYGVFAVSACGAALLLAFDDRAASFVKRLPRSVIGPAVMMVAFFVPVIAWTAYVIAKTGAFYSQEIDLFRQFVWMLDSMEAGGVGRLAADMGIKLTAYLEVLVPVAAFPITVLVVAGTLRRRVAPGERDDDGDARLKRAVVWFAIADIAFFALLGTYETRLAWSIVPAVIVLIGIEIRAVERYLPPARRKAMRGLVMLTAIAYCAWWIARPGPYS